MPINIPDGIPAFEFSRGKTSFACEVRRQAAGHSTNQCAASKPHAKKIETEIHLLRMLPTPLQVNVEFLRISERPSKHTPIEHMDNFYKEFKQIKNKKYDGMIITGAPLGNIPFDQVTYWEEMTEILDWTLSNVTSVMFLCWAVQAAMFHLYNVEKVLLPKKISGVYPHRLRNHLSPVSRGFDEIFDAPHSRYAEVPGDKICEVELDLIADSEIAGAYLWAQR